MMIYSILAELMVNVIKFIIKKSLLEISEYQNINLYSESERRPDCVYCSIDLI